MTWSDKMSDMIGCVALDGLGATIAVAHGEHVSVASQTTICTRVFEMPRFSLKRWFQRCGQKSGTFPTHPHSISSRRCYPPLRPVPSTFCKNEVPSSSHTLSTVLCTMDFARFYASANLSPRCWDTQSLAMKWKIVPRTCFM